MSNLTAKVHKLGSTDKEGKPCKGTLSVYGLNAKFPITLYANQWRTLAAAMPGIVKLIDVGLKDGTLAAERTAQTAKSGDRVAL